jgi:type II secretory pathway pseudopilin PulG
MGRRGFSLTELLCVAIIIMLVFAMVVPVIVRAREKANQANCLSSMRQISTALTQYNIENEGYPYCPRGVRGGHHWGHHLVPYMEGIRNFVCPSSDADKYQLGGTTPPDFQITYGVNEYLLAGRVNESDLPPPVEMALVADSVCPWSGPGAVSGYRYLWQASPSFGPTIHRDGCMFAFMDGHLKWLPADLTAGKGRGYRGNYDGAYKGAVVYEVPKRQRDYPDLPPVRR